MKILIITSMIAGGFALLGCGEESAKQVPVDEKIQSVEKAEKIEKKTSSKNKFLVTIGKVNESGADCSVGITLKNKTGKEVSLFQFMKYTATTKTGTQSDNGSNFSLKNGETSTRAGLMIMGTTCANVSEIKVDEMYCWYDGYHQTFSDEFKCASDVVLKGGSNIKLTR